MLGFALLGFVPFVGGEEMPWLAGGSVTSVTGAGFGGLGVSAGDPVTVRFSYDTGAAPTVLAMLPILGYTKAGYSGPVALRVTIEIGELTWSGSLDEAADGTYPLVLTDFAEVAATDEMSVVLATTQEGTSFTSFPGGGEAGVLREITLLVVDAEPPPGFLSSGFPGSPPALPTGETDTCQITGASGTVKSGSEVIGFKIDPISIIIGPEPSAGTPVSVAIAQVAGETELRWDSLAGKRYEVQRSCHLRSWSPVSTHEGTGGAASVLLPPFAAPAGHQFYRVVELD